ncbi:radical SAM protein [candidate division KSB1 bacterium]|nr:radical SAM protein [candidate division KSB1 bacterium]RQW06584.1 MAG: radical SAM protein [candidate division KSB1 bacterium]
MAFDKKSVLLFNPWICDFAAYDFWFKPLGLLSVGAVLRAQGYDVQLVDCLDRFHPALLNVPIRQKTTIRPDHSGKFHREIIRKPDVLNSVPRHYARYGMPYDLVERTLGSLRRPDIVLVTSFMTYWYPAVVDAILLLRKCFPEAKIILGGIYASLCAEHARTCAAPDYIITGEGEVKAVRLIAELLNGPGRDYHYRKLDDLPMPAFDLYPCLNSVALLTSRGCPNACSFCASGILASGYRRRSVANVVDEIRFWRLHNQVRHFAFYDDALLHRSSQFIKPILRQVQENGWAINFYTPNGLTPRYIDAEMAALFFTANVRHICLSFETSNDERQKAMSAKVTNSELIEALNNLERAGYERRDIGVYVLMGLPGQSVDEVRHSAAFVHRLGARVRVASFSPIPGTLEWQKAVDLDLWQLNADPLLTNSSIFPIWSSTIGYQHCLDLLLWIKSLNDQLLKE